MLLKTKFIVTVREWIPNYKIASSNGINDERDRDSRCCIDL